MGTLEELGVTSVTPHICIVATNAGCGKTTLLAIMIGDLVKQGKKILIVNELGGTPRMFQKLKKTEINVLSNQILSYETGGDRTLSEMIGSRDFDYVVLDIPSHINDKITDEICELAMNKKVNVILSTQLQRRAAIIDGFKTTVPEVKESKLLNASTYVVTMDKWVSFSFLETIKYKVLPFIYSTPNVTINLIRNRFGGNKEIKKHLDFDKVKIS